MIDSQIVVLLLLGTEIHLEEASRQDFHHQDYLL
jgi:hypothetical protein